MVLRLVLALVLVSPLASAQQRGEKYRQIKNYCRKLLKEHEKRLADLHALREKELAPAVESIKEQLPELSRILRDLSNAVLNHDSWAVAASYSGSHAALESDIKEARQARNQIASSLAADAMLDLEYQAVAEFHASAGDLLRETLAASTKIPKAEIPKFATSRHGSPFHGTHCDLQSVGSVGEVSVSLHKGKVILSVSGHANFLTEDQYHPVRWVGFRVYQRLDRRSPDDLIIEPGEKVTLAHIEKATQAKDGWYSPIPLRFSRQNELNLLESKETKTRIENCKVLLGLKDLKPTRPQEQKKSK